MRSIAIGILLASITYGCVRQGSYEMVMLPNGTVGSVVECSSKATCFRQASKACSGTYHVLEANDQPANDFLMAPDRGTAEYVIQCMQRSESSSKEDNHAQ